MFYKMQLSDAGVDLEGVDESVHTQLFFNFDIPSQRVGALQGSTVYADSVISVDDEFGVLAVFAD